MALRAPLIELRNGQQGERYAVLFRWDSGRLLAYRYPKMKQHHTWQEGKIAPSTSFVSHWFGRHLYVPRFLAYFCVWTRKRFDLQQNEGEACLSHRTVSWHEWQLYFFSGAYIRSEGCLIYFILWCDNKFVNNFLRKLREQSCMQFDV